MIMGFAHGTEGLVVVFWYSWRCGSGQVSQSSPHFPTVVGVMVSNSPALSFLGLEKDVSRLPF